MNTDRILTLATEAGHILLENGAEIERVEETMERIADHYGVRDESFFVLSNGIIATGQHYARAKFIPIRGTQLERVVEVNQLSREVQRGGVSLDALEARLRAIRAIRSKPWWENTLGIALGVSSFSILFGGSLPDAAASLAAGLLLGLFMTFAGPHLSRMFGNIAGGMVGALLCIGLWLATASGGQSALHLSNMIIGTIIALVPGVPFTNGIRDLANEDYIAGSTRLLDAFMMFLCIALGVSLGFIVHGRLSGGLIPLPTPSTDPLTSALWLQVLAAFVGTVGFSVLFGAPRGRYVECGLAGAAGWAVYRLCIGGGSPAEAALAGATVVGLASGLLARLRHCPTTVFLICGIIPLVPGGGIFWTAYYIVSDQLPQALATGFTALKVTIAIALGIILAGFVVKLASRHRYKKHKQRA